MIEIQRTGSGIHIVDLGRYGYRSYGVPISGAMDLHSAASANSVLSNPINSAVLEMYLSGHQFTFHLDTTIAFSGAQAEIKVDDRRVYTDQAIHINKGAQVSIGGVAQGARTYLAVHGGFDTKILLGSRSPITGFFSRSLYKGDKIDFLESQANPITSANIKSLKINQQKVISCQPGPEWHFINKANQKKILTNIYKITNDSNRMGYRLSGNAVKAKKIEILSSAVLPGTVQLLPSGIPVILMRDCQTTGGYPRILQIIDADINQLAQRRPNDEVHFEIESPTKSRH